MQPQFRICSDNREQFYFQLISADQRCIFESIRFISLAMCGKNISELKNMRRLDEHIHKTEQERAFSFIITNRKREIIGSGQRHFAFMTRNLDIHTLRQQITAAEIVENIVEAV